jgi:hypothetical protein
MKSPVFFIVSPREGKRYDNTRGDIYLSTSKEDHLATMREAIVIETPLGYDGPIQAGDTIIVHHNTFRLYFNMAGKEKSAWNHFKDDLFFVDDPYAYRKEGGNWKGIGRYVFVEPVDNHSSGIRTIDAELPLVGKIKYANDEVLAMGLNEGDTISFEPNSEYPFTMDGQKVYRMYTSNIRIKL